MVELIEAAIVSRLSSEINDIPSRVFPGSPDEYKKIPVTRGLILVRYVGSDLSEPTNTDNIIQERRLQFIVNLQIRNLSDHKDSYSILESIMDALSGFSPLNDKRVLFISKEQFLDYVDGLWLWAQLYELRIRQA